MLRPDKVWEERMILDLTPGDKTRGRITVAQRDAQRFRPISGEAPGYVWPRCKRGGAKSVVPGIAEKESFTRPRQTSCCYADITVPLTSEGIMSTGVVA